MVRWSHGLVVRWSHGLVVRWSHGPVVRWSHGPVVPWSGGPVVPWSGGPVVPWSGGPVVPWSGGPMVRWSHGLVVRWSHGPQPGFSMSTSRRSPNSKPLPAAPLTLSVPYQTCRSVPRSSSWCWLSTNIKGAQSDTRATEVSNSGLTWLTRLALANALIPH